MSEGSKKDLVAQLEKVESFATSVMQMAAALQEECHKARLSLGTDSSVPVRPGFQKTVNKIVGKRKAKITNGMKQKNQRATAGSL